jgi:hypothetical protein
MLGIHIRMVSIQGIDNVDITLGRSEPLRVLP